jgi:hypothetical protein
VIANIGDAMANQKLKLIQQEYEDLLLKKNKTEEEIKILEEFEKNGEPVSGVYSRIGKNGYQKY